MSDSIFHALLPALAAKKPTPVPNVPGYGTRPPTPTPVPTGTGFNPMGGTRPPKPTPIPGAIPYGRGFSAPTGRSLLGR